MAFCINCGQELAEGAKFCASCGNAEYLTRWGPGLLRLGAIMSFGGYCVS
ncbi:zinc-ribbon domain-containing protein, partial [Bifidobacterium bifidum]